MKQFKWQIILILAAVAAFFAYPYFAPVELPLDGFSTMGADTVRAEVTQILEEGQIDMDGHTQKYQVVRVKILDGTYAGIPMEIDYGRREIRSDEYSMSVGDKVVVLISKTAGNEVNAYFVDFVRTTPILWLTIIFAAAIILISKWKGVRSLLSMAFSLYVII